MTLEDETDTAALQGKMWALDTLGPRRANDPAHGNEGATSMRDERIARARQMRAEGRLLREIAAEFDVAIQSVVLWLRADKPCECGCGEVTTARFVFGHHARIAVYYRVDAATGCWDWLGSKDRKGYGQIGRDGRLHRAPRYFYEQAKGAIPDGLEIDHLCHNKGCVNPGHLEAVTAATNSQRRRNTKLTWDDVRVIRASGLGCTEVARRWGVSVSNASAVLRGVTWRES